MIGLFFASLVGIGITILVIVGLLRKKRRRESLHRSDDGTLWIWIELDGTERSSTRKPDEPGGDWHSGGGGFDDGGGLGGSDGGGGGD